MSKTISVTDFRNNYADYLSQVAYGGESFRLLKGKKIIAKILPPDENIFVKGSPLTKLVGRWKDESAIATWLELRENQKTIEKKSKLKLINSR